ncbi:MAG: hypothetical protein EOP68_24065 [Sphingomonas sp.]|nr:MAG: hypothetical protein EOP68_24065 [Sphingomonas sp.]
MKPRCALIVVLAATLGATAAPAQYNPQQERRVALQRTGSSTGYARDWRDFHRYDVGRPEPGQSIYDADRYRRDARFYRPRTLAAGDRVYRGLSGLFTAVAPTEPPAASRRWRVVASTACSARAAARRSRRSPTARSAEWSPAAR